MQTYQTNATTGTAVAVTDFVGGTNPAVADPGNGSAGATFEHLDVRVLGGVERHGAVGDSCGGGRLEHHAALDAGFNFDMIVNTNNIGQGSLRQLIDNANLLGGDASLAQAGLVAAKENAVFMISNGTSAAGLRASNNYFSGGVATIAPTSAFAAISAPRGARCAEAAGLVEHTSH